MKLLVLGFLIGLVGLLFLMQRTTLSHMIGIIVVLIGAGVALKGRRELDKFKNE